MATLRASEQGKKRIQQARNDQGWIVDDPRWLVEASNILEPHRNWEVENPPFANGVSEGTWRAFLYRQRSIDTEVFKAYCQVLGLSWEEIREVTNKALVSQSNSNWQEVCRNILEEQRQSHRLRQQITGLGNESNFYVRLGLVERKHQSRRSSDFSLPPEQGSGFFQLSKEEIIKTYEHDDFLEQVIKQGQSKKSQGKRIAIIGEPGAGKTTLLEAIAFSPKTPGFPIWISLGSLGEKSLAEYLQQKWLKDALKTSDVTQHQKALEELFKSGQVLLLLDGVDEMPVPSPVEALAKIREELTGWVADARVVLTCRVNVWDASVNALQGFDTYRTLEFSYGDGNKPDQVRQFICEWFSKTDKPDLGEPLRKKLDEDRHQRIRDLVKNPLRLSLLCQSWYSCQGNLPKTKALLYNQFTEAFYEWKKEAYSTTLTEREELNVALGRLAREAIDQEESRFRIRRDFALNVMGEDLFELATEKLNWLVHVYNDAETGKPVYAFFHPTFQEYFAACVIDDWHFFLNHNNKNPNPFLKYNNQDCVYRVFEQQWKEVILLWLGREDVLKAQKEAFIEVLVEFDGGYGYENEKFYEYRAYFLAAAGISEFAECSLVDKIVKQVVKWSFGQFDFKYQAMQYEVSFQVADVAKTTLLETDHYRVIPVLIELSQTPLPERVLHQVIECLEDIGTGNPEVRVTLIDLIDKSHDEQIIIKAAESLEKIDPGNPKVILTLLNLIHNSADEFICFRASDDLWRIAPGHPEAIEVVDAEPNVFSEVVKSEQIDLNNPDVIEWLVKKVRSSPNNETDKFKGIKLVETLGYIIPGNSEAIKALIDLIHTTPNEVIFRQAVRSLGRIGKGDSKALAVLIDLSRNSQDWVIQSVAVQSLRHAETSYTQAIEVLIDRICNSSDEDVQIQASESLGQILQRHPSVSAISALKDCLVTPFYEKDCDLYLRCDDVLWRCAQTIPYPDFYRAWHSQSCIVQSLENQLTDIPSQIKTTDKTYAIAIDTKTLKLETNKSIIAQKLCTKIYRKAGYFEIPTVSDAAQLQQYIPRIQEKLQKPNLALILHGCEPDEHLLNFCYSLADPDIGFYIGLITSQPIEQPLKGFLPHQPNLSSAIQSWINEIG